MNGSLTNERLCEIHKMYDQYINDTKLIIDIKQKLLHEVFDIMVNVITEYDPIFDIEKHISIGQRTVDLKVDDMTYISIEHYKTNTISVNSIIQTCCMERPCDCFWVQISISCDGKLTMKQSNPLRPMLREIIKRIDILVKAHNIKQTLVINN